MPGDEGFLSVSKKNHGGPRLTKSAFNKDFRISERRAFWVIACRARPQLPDPSSQASEVAEVKPAHFLRVPTAEAIVDRPLRYRLLRRPHEAARVDIPASFALFVFSRILTWSTARPSRKKAS